MLRTPNVCRLAGELRRRRSRRGARARARASAREGASGAAGPMAHSILVLVTNGNCSRRRRG
eukprot:449362-Lingulodinium_polyedra.AAC.1